jgi:ubiquinone/menaquinone biosynthesis C-methylase UbiE
MGPLYRKAVREYNRVLRPGSRAVLLVADHPLLLEATKKLSWKLESKYLVRVLGQKATMSVWRKPT